MDGGAHRQHPISVYGSAVLVTHKDMCGRQPLDVGERRSSRFPDHVEEEKIRDGKIVQSPRDSRMLADAIQRVAEEKEISQLGVVKRLNAEVIPRAKQLLIARIPDREGKIPSD